MKRRSFRRYRRWAISSLTPRNAPYSGSQWAEHS